MIPWFVSDVTPPDFKQTIQLLLDPKFTDSTPQSANYRYLVSMVSRWQRYIEREVFSLSVPEDLHLGDNTHGKADFWTLPYPYWNMKTYAPELFNYLSTSDLVIFKVNVSHVVTSQAELYDHCRVISSRCDNQDRLDAYRFPL